MPKNQEFRRLFAAVTTVVSVCALGAISGCAGADRTGADTSVSAERSAPASESPSPKSAVAVTPTPDPTVSVQVGKIVQREAREATGRFIAVTQNALAAPERPTRRPSGVVGSAWNSVLAMRTEYAAKHYRVVGKAEVVAQHVVRRTGKPPTLVVAACLDSSNVRVLDRRGETVPGGAGPARSLNLITLEHRQGAWVVVATSFPDDPNC